MLIYSNDNQINRLFLCDHFQIEKFVLQLKKTPCWEKAQPQESLLRQKCRSTNWIVLASFLTNLFALKGKVRILIKRSRRRRRAADKDEHSALYKINKNVHIQTSKIIYRRNIVYLEHHTRTHTHACTRACTHRHTHACMHTHARTYACTHAHIQPCAHARTHTHTHTQAHTHMGTLMRTHTHAHAHTRMHTHEHTHTHMPVHIRNIKGSEREDELGRGWGGCQKEHTDFEITSWGILCSSRHPVFFAVFACFLITWKYESMHWSVLSFEFILVLQKREQWRQKSGT